jgi:uncharacterized protein YodC (DUF2158 family)
MTVKIGDVVRLRSGGPEMTVARVRTERDGTSMAHAYYMIRDKDGERPTNYGFPVSVLEVVRSAPGFDIAPLEGMSMSPAWHIKNRTAAIMERMRRRLETFA